MVVVLPLRVGVTSFLLARVSACTWPLLLVVPVADARRRWWLVLVGDGLDVFGGLVDFLRWSLVVLAVPFVRCAVDVHVEVPEVLGDL